MIRRRTADGILLIRQTDHARLAAELAAAVGNEKFAPPLPRAAVLQAIELHDCGWPLHDDRPTTNSRGEPTDVFEMPPAEALAIWTASTQKASEIDPYVGLLVSLHGMALSLHIKPEKSRERSDIFSLIKFQHAQIELQEEFRRQLGMSNDLPLHNGLADFGSTPEEDLLRSNFSLLQFTDQLSLNLCFDECRFADVELFAQPGEQPRRLAVERRKDGAFSVEPWPFDRAALNLTVPARKIPYRRYASQEDLRSALSIAETATLSATLRR
jgi:hypothetical protein